MNLLKFDMFPFVLCYSLCGSLSGGNVCNYPLAIPCSHVISINVNMTMMIMMMIIDTWPK